MKRSLNEVEQTCRKAAKGCGLPWGIADEVGKAIRWLHMFGLDGCGCVVRHLSQLDHDGYAGGSPVVRDGVWEPAGRLLSPLLTGPGFCDCIAELDEAGIETGAIAYPLLVAGLLGQVVREPDQAVRIVWQGVAVDLYNDRLLVSGLHESLYTARAMSMKISRPPPQSPAVPGKFPVIGDTDIRSDIWSELERYAYRTYVAATDENRLSGAGAGLQDND